MDKKILFTTFTFITILIIAIFVGMYYFDLNDWQNLQPPQNGQDFDGDSDKTEIPIQSEYDSKIVYTTDMDFDQSELREHCELRGGDFNECGNICEPEGGICIEVCAYTCENIATPETGLERYINEKMGVSLVYPADMLTIQENERELEFNYWGPTQRTGTELYDGINLTLRMKILEENNTITDYILDDIAEAKIIGEVISGISTTTINNITARTYTIRTLGVLNKIIFALEDENYDFLEIMHSTPDPENFGYSEIVKNMLDTLIVLNARGEI